MFYSQDLNDLTKAIILEMSHLTSYLMLFEKIGTLVTKI